MKFAMRSALSEPPSPVSSSSTFTLASAPRSVPTVSSLPMNVSSSASVLLSESAASVQMSANWVSTILLWSTSALSPLRPPESVPLVPASALSPALSCGSALELSVLRAPLIAFSVVVLVCENWSMVLCALVAAVFVESLSWVSAASVAAAFR